MSNFWAEFSRVSAPARTVRPSRFWQEWEQAESSQRQQPAIERMIAEAAGRYRVPVDLAIALARAESGLDPAARSRAGAIGVMQLMPSTAKQLGVNPYDVGQNIEGGVRYLRRLYDQFGDWRLAVAAYNAGPGAVQKYGGIPPFPETRAHVERVFSLLAPTGRLKTEEERRGAGQRLMQSIQERREREQREIREILEREFGGGQLSEQALRASPALRMAVDIPRHLIRGAIPILPIRTTREEAEVRGQPIEAFGRFGPQVQVPVPGGQIRIQPSVEGILGAGAEMLGATLAFGPFARAARAIAPGLVSALERLPLRYALGNVTLGTLVGALQGAADVAEDVRQGKVSPQEAARQVAMQAGLTGAAFGALHAALSGTFHLVRAGRLSVRKLRELADSAREAARRAEQPAAAPAAPVEQRPPQLEAPPPARPTPRPVPEAAPRPDRPAGVAPAPEPKPPAARPRAQPEAAPPAAAKPPEPPPGRPVAPARVEPAPEQIQPPPAEAPPSQIQAETGEPPSIRVSRTVLRTARGSQEQASLAVVDLGEVVTSHTPEGLPRPEYVQHGGVQPRARERAASGAQIARIAQTLEPERLVLDTSDPATGSPVVAPSVHGGAWVVESGNARVAALDLASRRYPDRYAAYLEAVKERLRAHGQDPSIVDEMVSRGQRPVLVRIRESNLHPEGRARFAAEANEPSVLKMSPSEQARSDAAMISDELMGELRVGEDIASPANRPFVRAFMSRLPLEEQAAMLTESGELSRAGADRIRAAILARAYGDENLLQLSLDDLDPAVNGILNTLASVAGRVARYRALVSQQAAYRELDISQDLARAAVTLNRLIRQRENVDNWLAQTQLLSEESDLTRAIVRLMHGMRRSHRKLGLILDRYYDMAERAGGPGAPTLPGFERPVPPSAAELLDRAAESLRADQTELLRVLSPVPPEARGRSAFAPQGAESVKIHEIVAKLEDAFSVPIRLGRFPALLSSRVAGFYKRIPQVIRRKVYGDLQTIYHELGHHLDNMFKLSQPDAPYAQELLGLFERSGLDPSAYPSVSARLKEGVAEFVRMLYTDPERLPQVAPQFHAHFWKVVGTHDRLADALTKSIRDYQRWVSQPAWAMVSSMIEDSPGARGPKTPFFWRIYEEWVNDIAPLDRMLRELGIPRGEQPNPASLAQLMRGWVGQAEVFIERGIRDRKGTLLAPSLREVLEPVADRLDEFRIYAVARRAAELMDRGKSTGFEQLRPQITQVLVEGAQRGYDKVLDRLVQWQNALVQATLVDSGLMSPELAKAIFAKNTAYIPFYRLFDWSGWTAVRAGAGLMNVRSPVKRLVGSTRPVEDPLVNILANTYAYTQAAAKQRVLLALTKLTRYPGAGKWIEKVPPPSVATRVSVRRVLEAAEQHLGPQDAKDLSELLEALGTKLSSEYVTLFDPARWPGRKEAREHVIAVSYQGKLNWYQVHPDVYRFLAQNPSEAMANVFVRVLGPIARTLRAGAVLSLDFIVRNLIRDQFVATVQSRYGYIPFVDLARGLFHALGKTDVWELWASSGASGAALAALDRNFLRGQLNSILGRGGMGRVISKYASLESLRALSELVENSTRIGEFARALRQEARKYGVDPTWRGLASLRPEVREEILAKAALSAREVTIDFSRAGRSGRVINSVSAFWNARVQGVDRLARAFRDDPYGATARAVLWITMPSIALWWLNRDNPEYQELPEWRKVAFWHLPVPWWDGRVHLIPVPKPFELGILFGGLPEAVLEWVYRKDPEAVRARISALVAQPVSDLLAGFFPTAVQPVVEAVANYSFFRDRPIVPMSEQRLPPELQYGPYQTEAAKGMAQLVKRLTGVGVSPRVIEHLVRGYLGSLGMTALGLPDIVLGSTRGSLVAPVERVPGLSAFVERPYAEPESVRRFYRRLRSLEQAHAGEQAAAGIRGLTPPPELAVARTTQRELAELRNMIQAILTDPSLPAAEKHRIVRDLTLQMIAAARAASGLPPLEQRP